jgi:hypothetical protein
MVGLENGWWFCLGCDKVEAGKVTRYFIYGFACGNPVLRTGPQRFVLLAGLLQDSIRPSGLWSPFRSFKTSGIIAK